MGSKTERVRPFYCGSQGVDWESMNCENCSHSGYYSDENQTDWVNVCDIQTAIGEAFWSDGSIPADIATRMGYTGNDFGWKCLEMDPVHTMESWIAHCSAPPTDLIPIWERLWRAAELTWNTWTPWWKVEDPEDAWGSISLRLGWVIAWGIHREDRRVKRGWKRPELVEVRNVKT